MSFKNSIGGLIDDLIYTKEEKDQAEILNKLASSPTSNNWIYIIPVAGLVVFGVIVLIIKKKQTS